MVPSYKWWPLLEQLHQRWVTLAEQRDTIAGPEAQVGDKNTSGWSKVQTQVGDVDGDENENENENANTLEHQVKKPALPIIQQRFLNLVRYSWAQLFWSKKTLQNSSQYKTGTVVLSGRMKWYTVGTSHVRIYRLLMPIHCSVDFVPHPRYLSAFPIVEQTPLQCILNPLPCQSLSPFKCLESESLMVMYRCVAK